MSLAGFAYLQAIANVQSLEDLEEWTLVGDHSSFDRQKDSNQISEYVTLKTFRSIRLLI